MAMSSRPLLRSRYIVTQLPRQCVVGGVSSLCHESPARPVAYAVPMRRGCRAHVAWTSAGRLPDVYRTSAGFRPDAVKPVFHGVRTHWIRGFMAFNRVGSTWTVLLMVPA